MSERSRIASRDRKSTRLNSSHDQISYAVFCLKKKKIDYMSHSTDRIIGIGATHIENTRSVSVRGGEGFPMVSAFKVPVAVQLMCIFFFNDTATTEIYTLSLHDALPIGAAAGADCRAARLQSSRTSYRKPRSEEHTSELQSRSDLVCRLLLEKKKHN